VCAGGADHGHFATIRVRKPDDHDDDDDSDPFASGPAYDAMSLDGDGENPSGGSGRARLSVKELGGYIVNSVTLHRPPSSTSDDDVLAVLTYGNPYGTFARKLNSVGTLTFVRGEEISNNDKTVRIFHLADNRVITTLHVDVSTNHASISPDGQHLVVVGDSPEVYFYHPANTGSRSGSPATGIGEAGCGSWILSSHPPLSAGTENDALMSTSFSSSSLHCAVASQAGIITIFDTRYLACDDGCDPLVKVITSSRAFKEPGAVRSVQFSSAPWDLLVWAEHSGRVCIADARSNFARRQIIDVLSGKDELIEAEVEEVQDHPSAWDISQRLGSPTTLPTGRHPRDDEEAEERILMSGDTSINELAGLVIDTSSEWLAARVRNTPNGPVIADAGSLSTAQYQMLRMAGVGSGLPTTPALLRDYRERQIERERARQRTHDPPRRRNSIHPSYADHSTSTPADYSSGPTSAAATPSERERSRQSRVVSVSLRPLEQITNLIAEQRRRQRRSERFEAEAASSSYPYASDGVDITGCTLGLDGKKLQVRL